MAKRFRSAEEVRRLASMLKERRLALGLTLKDVEKIQNINCGQISRIEAGRFKTASPNLQKLCQFLQIDPGSSAASREPLGLRLERFAAQSAVHRAAAEEVLNALERLG